MMAGAGVDYMSDDLMGSKPIVVGSCPPDSPALTDYDRAHVQLYIRLLDAASSGVQWMVAAREILNIDPTLDLDSAKRTFDSHLARAEWMTRVGYRFLQGSGQ